MTTPFTSYAFTPPDLNDPNSVIRAILQLQSALTGGTTNPIPKNNLNRFRSSVPANKPLFSTTTTTSTSSTSGLEGTTLIIPGGFL